MDEVDLLGLKLLELEASQFEQKEVRYLVPVETTQNQTNADVLLQFEKVTLLDSEIQDVRIARNQRHDHAPFSSNVMASSILDDRTFCPPPPLPNQINIVKFDFFAESDATNVSSLPTFERVMHSGKLLSRISIRSLITRSWKEVFWIIYGAHQLIFFRCMRDYEEWLLNPYLSQAERLLFVKLKIDFEKDLSVTGIRGYQSTDVRPKSYRRRGILFQFKVDSMTSYGPSLVGAFASSDRKEVAKLHRLFCEMMNRSPLNSSLLKLNMRHTPLNTPRGDSEKSLHSLRSSSAPSFALSPEEEQAGSIRFTPPRMDSMTSTITGSF